MAELRCPSGKLYGVLNRKILEVKCNKPLCGARSGVVVIHQFDAGSGAFIETKRFKEPGKVTNVRSID